MKRSDPVGSASGILDARIRELGDWRGKMLAHVRDIIHQADAEIVEEWKWVKPTSPELPCFRTAASSARERRTRTSSR